MVQMSMNSLPIWNPEDYIISSINISLWWGNENHNNTRKQEANVFSLNVLHWKLMNGGKSDEWRKLNLLFP